MDQSTLTPAQVRGKLIYEEGRSTEGPAIMASVEEMQISASALTCVNCHGERGIGNPEGGVTPANLQWSYLTNAYAVEFANGRTRIAYNESTLAKAISSGIDPSGNVLHVAMPRYTMSSGQMNDLTAYLKVIHQFAEPGIYPDRIHVGVILEPENGQAIQEILSAYFHWINSKGGIYNREIIPYYYSNGPENDFTLEEFISKNELFAFVASSLSNSDTNVSTLQSLEIPVLGALSGNPSTAEVDDPFYFLFPDAALLATDMILYLEKKLSSEKAIIIYKNETPSESIVQYLKNKLSIKTLSNFQFISVDNSSIHKGSITSEKNKIIINLLPLNQLNNLLIEGKLNADNLSIYIPGYLFTDDIFRLSANGAHRLFVTLPSWTTAHKDHALKGYQNLLTAYNLSPKFSASQYHALAAAQLFTEIIKRTGREVSRLEMIEEIENMIAFDTGFMPPMTYSPVDKIGSNHIYLISPDKLNKSFELVESRKLLSPSSR